jgi:hypothetical protein
MERLSRMGTEMDCTALISYRAFYRSIHRRFNAKAVQEALEFGSKNGNLFWCVDANSHFVSLDLGHRDRDAGADVDAFTRFSR